jgi:gamma-glutamylcyclotransferase (GGCT)/AIG2-like uncharacterized protein YtfP
VPGELAGATRVGNPGVDDDAPALEMTPLFVYGSLRRGGSNHRELSGARFLGETRTAANYALARIGEYPALVAGTENVSGELYAVDDALLEELDAFEGEAYIRGLIHLENGRPAVAYRLRTPRGDEEPWQPI